MALSFLLGFALLAVYAESTKINDAAPCEWTVCKVPDCMCSGETPPNNDTNPNPQLNPQIVMITFNDAVTAASFALYKQYLFDYTNPNGCEIGVTHFVSHPYTDYTLVHSLYADHGHEIALHTITGTSNHSAGSQYWKDLSFDGYVQELDGMVEILNKFGVIPKDDVNGARIPDLQTAGDTYFKALKSLSKTYDSTMPTRSFTDPPMFPYTLDYRSTQDCQIEPCPTDSYPGVWEVPLVDYTGTDGNPCALLDDCTISPNTSSDIYNFLVKNFNRHYTTNRAPFGIFMRADWMSSDTDHNGLGQFLDYLMDLSDVYIVSLSAALEWMKNPVTADQADSFQPWLCPPRPNKCPTKYQKVYHGTPVGDNVYLYSCVPCPTNYPWVGNPDGN